MTYFGTCVPCKGALHTISAANTGQPPALCAQDTTIRLDVGILPWPVRDQFGRGTCVAFATLAAIELLRARRDDMPPERLSEQFLHERMLSVHPLSYDIRAQIPEGGVLLQQALQALESEGFVPSDMMPYKPVAHDAKGTPNPAPSEEALTAGQNNRILALAYGTIGPATGLAPTRVEQITPGTDTAQKLLAFLQNGHPVAIGVPLFQHASGLSNWTLPRTIQTGLVLCPKDAGAPPLDSPREDGHVVCLTGFEPDPDEPLGGWFIFRNSWGLEFADHAAIAKSGLTAGLRGYGKLSATHVNAYCWEYLVPSIQCPNTM